MHRFAVGVLLGVALFLAPCPVQAEPFTVDAFLKMEAFGQASIDPAETRLVFERQAPRDSASVYDHDFHNQTLRSELFTADLGRPAAATRLLRDDEGLGHRLGSWSPSGRRLLLYRLRDRVWQAGIFDVEAGSVRWLDVTPELPSWGRTAQWRSDDELILVARTDGLAPWLMRAPWEFMVQLPQAWAMTRQGQRVSRTVIGSGAYAGLTPKRGPNALMRIDAGTGEVQRLAEAGFYDLELSPDGRFAAAAAFGEDLPLDPDAPFLQGEFPRARTLRIVDLETGEAWNPKPGADLLPNLLSWSPRGDALLVWTRHGAQPWSQGRLHRIDTLTRDIAELPLGGMSPAFQETGLRTPVVVADWLGGTPVLLAETGAGRKDWIQIGGTHPKILTAGLAAVATRLTAVTQDSLFLVADDAAWRITHDGRTRLTSEETPVRPTPPDVVDKGQRFFFNDPPSLERSGVQTREGRAVRLRDGDEASRILGQGTVLLGKTVSVAEVSDDRFRQSLVVTRDGGSSVVVSRINAAFGEIEFVRPRAVHHQGPSGEALVSWLYLPHRHTGEERPPLVVTPYPGTVNAVPDPTAGATSASVGPNVQILAGAGFAVLVPSLPRAAYPGEPSAGMADQILAVVDAAAQGGDFDTGRIALWGHSFGAHAALTAATQSSRFDAIVASNGAYDLASDWGEFDPAQRVIPDDMLSIRSSAGWVETGQARMGGPPWQTADRYVRNSPLFQADRITAPVLLVTGDRDYVPSSQAEIMFTALYRQHKDAVLLTYWGEGHVLQSPANIRDMTLEVLGWLGDHLAVTPSPPLRSTTPGSSSPSWPGS